MEGFDVAGITAAALSFGQDSTPATPAANTQTPPVEAPAAAAPAAPTQDATPPATADGNTATPAQQAQPDYADLPDTSLVRIKVDGQEQIIPWGEAKKQMMLHGKFTKEMQTLRTQEKTWQQQLQEAEQVKARNAQLEQLVLQPQALAGWIAQSGMLPFVAQQLGLTQAQAAAAIAAGHPTATAVAQATQAPQAPFQGDPEELATLGQAQQLFDTRVASLQQSFQGTTQQLQQAIEGIRQSVLGEVQQAVQGQLAQLDQARQVAAADQKIETTITTILDRNPVLSKIPFINDTLRYQTAQLGPKSEAEAIEFMETVAKGMVEGLDEVYNAKFQAAAVQKQQLATNGIEPPRGTAAIQAPPVQDFMKKDGTGDWSLLTKMALARLQ
jgi:hypothetical protein